MGMAWASRWASEIMADTKRRQYGTGSVVKRADGKWVGRLEAGFTATGNRRRLTVIADTEADCKRRLKEKQRQLAVDRQSAVTTRATVRSWSATWLERHVVDVRPSTFTTDQGAVRKWIVPTIGHRRLEDLTPGDVHAVSAAIRQAGRTSTTARQAHWTLLGMLKAAVAEGHMVSPRVLIVRAPAKAANDRDAIPLPDALRLVQEALRRPDAARWICALLQGLRQAEALGLTWDYVDLDAGEIDVSWQLQSLPRRTDGPGFRVPDGFEHRHLTGSWHLTRPKTSKGRRIIPLDVWVWDALAQWRTVAPENPWGLVWSVDGKPVNPREDRAVWADIQDAAGVTHASGRRYVGHEARHTAATLMLEAKVDPKTVETLLGHSSILTSRGYQHVSTTLGREAMQSGSSRLGLGNLDKSLPSGP
jgi:integrase